MLPYHHRNDSNLHWAYRSRYHSRHAPKNSRNWDIHIHHTIHTNSNRLHNYCNCGKRIFLHLLHSTKLSLYETTIWSLALSSTVRWIVMWLRADISSQPIACKSTILLKLLTTKNILKISTLALLTLWNMNDATYFEDKERNPKVCYWNMHKKCIYIYISRMYITWHIRWLE